MLTPQPLGHEEEQFGLLFSREVFHGLLNVDETSYYRLEGGWKWARNPEACVSIGIIASSCWEPNASPRRQKRLLRGHPRAAAGWCAGVMAGDNGHPPNDEVALIPRGLIQRLLRR